MLSDGKKAPVARDDMACPSFHGSGEVLVVIGVLADTKPAEERVSEVREAPSSALSIPVYAAASSATSTRRT
jgi:hypothetical protein